MSFSTGKKWFMIFINIKVHASLFDGEKKMRAVSRLLLINRLVIKSTLLIKKCPDLLLINRLIIKSKLLIKKWPDLLLINRLVIKSKSLIKKMTRL